MNIRLRHALFAVVLAAVPLHAATSAAVAEDAGTPANATAPEGTRLQMLAMRAGELGARVTLPLAVMHAQALTAALRKDVPSSFGTVLTLADQLPLLGPVRRLAGNRWNTTDSSRPNDFAVCYRFSRSLGLQVIPGDLTPSKLPVPRMVSVTYQNSGIGVMAGMTLRIGRRR